MDYEKLKDLLFQLRVLYAKKCKFNHDIEERLKRTGYATASDLKQAISTLFSDCRKNPPNDGIIIQMLDNLKELHLEEMRETFKFSDYKTQVDAISLEISKLYGLDEYDTIKFF